MGAVLTITKTLGVIDVTILTKDSTTAALLDVRAVAQLLGCSTRHVIRLADNGAMPKGLKVGALRRWRKAELTSWLENGAPAVQNKKGGAR